MQVLALLCVALASTGCFSPHFDDCRISCASGNGCPDGTSCIAGICRLGGRTDPCTLPMSDADPDTISTDGDNGVADEDNDGMLDDVDPCPISANNTDTDGDGVGDNCEPIASGTDKILRFEGFHGTSLPSDAVVVGSWTVSGGKARVVSAANLASSVTFQISSPIGVRETIWARVTVDGLFSTPTDPTGAGVLTRSSDGASDGIQCGLGRDPGTGTDHLMLVKVASAADSNFMSNASIATPGTSAVLQITRNPSTLIFACNQPSNTIAYMPPTPVPMGTLAGIRTRSMSATFDWVMIMSSQ